LRLISVDFPSSVNYAGLDSFSFSYCHVLTSLSFTPDTNHSLTHFDSYPFLQLSSLLFVCITGVSLLWVRAALRPAAFSRPSLFVPPML
jgi:hypothetical protein